MKHLALRAMTSATVISVITVVMSAGHKFGS
jgi:hypothetical protein